MTKTLRFVLAAVCLIALPLPMRAQSSRISVRMSYGFSQGGALIESAVAPRGYEPYVTLGPKRRSNTGQDLLVEFFYQAHPRLTLALGIGHTRQTFPGNPVSYSSGASEVSGFLPEVGFESNPVLASIRLKLPLSPSWRFNILGGVGLYFTRYEGTADWAVWPLFQQSLVFSGSTRDTGYHAGLGLEIDASRTSIVSLEAIYRSASFGPFDNIVLRTEGGTLSDPGLSERGSQLYPLPDYKIDEVSLSGFVFLAGFKFRFQ